VASWLFLPRLLICGPPCWLSVGCDGSSCSVLSGFDFTPFSNSASLACYLGPSWSTEGSHCPIAKTWSFLSCFDLFKKCDCPTLAIFRNFLLIVSQCDSFLVMPSLTAGTGEDRSWSLVTKSLWKQQSCTQMFHLLLSWDCSLCECSSSASAQSYQGPFMG